MGVLFEGFRKIVAQDRFERLCAAFDAAGRWELYESQTKFGNKLLDMGAWIDDAGDWRQDTRPNKPVQPVGGGA